jgi:hypothetical protein
VLGGIERLEGVEYRLKQALSKINEAAQHIEKSLDKVRGHFHMFLSYLS